MGFSGTGTAGGDVCQWQEASSVHREEGNGGQSAAHAAQ